LSLLGSRSNLCDFEIKGYFNQWNEAFTGIQEGNGIGTESGQNEAGDSQRDEELHV
jgi:hypothetical protein